MNCVVYPSQLRYGTVSNMHFVAVSRCLDLYVIIILEIGKHNILSFLSRRIDDDRGKAYELGQSCVKCMRGILTCWMRQTENVENFKKGQHPKFALHSKFHLETGAEILSSDDYGHLQVSCAVY